MTTQPSDLEELLPDVRFFDMEPSTVIMERYGIPPAHRPEMLAVAADFAAATGRSVDSAMEDLCILRHSYLDARPNYMVAILKPPD